MAIFSIRINSRWRGKMAAAAILDNFEWPYLRNGSQSTLYSAHRAVIFAIAQFSCCHRQRYCCKGDERFQWEMSFFSGSSSSSSGTPEPIFKKFCTVDYVGDPTAYAKIWINDDIDSYQRRPALMGSSSCQPDN